jgi:hypothetical protein
VLAAEGGRTPGHGVPVFSSLGEGLKARVILIGNPNNEAGLQPSKKTNE